MIKFRFQIKTTFLIALGALAILFVLGIVWLRQIIVNHHRVRTDLKQRVGEVETLLNTSNVAPTSSNVSRFKEQFENTRKQYQSLLLLLDTATRPKLEITPLEFKEDLLKTQQLLSERAGLWNISIPSAIGFNEFEGGNIPAPEQVPHLTLQLDSLKTLINLLIESRVGAIEEIKRLDVRETSVTPNSVMYQVLPFELRFTGNMEILRTFLYKTYSSTHLFIVRRVDVEAKDNSSISTTIQIDAIKLKRES